MKTSPSKRELNRQRWYKSFTTWKQSGINPGAFCREHQLGLASFQRWRRIFEKEDNLKEAEPVNFLPIRVHDGRPSNLIVQINDRLRIEVPVEFDQKALKEVVQVLQAL